MRTHLVLARERKQILSILAGLVSQAKIAAVPNLSDSERLNETDDMLSMAENVLRNVEHFLYTASTCGVPVPSNIKEDSSDTFQAQQLLRLEDISTPNLDACLQFVPSEANGEMHVSTFASTAGSSKKALQKARSLSDVKVSKRKMSEASATSSSGSGSLKASIAYPARKSSQHGSSSGKAPSPPHLPKHPLYAVMLRRPSMPAVYTPSLISPAWQANESISSCTSSTSIGSSGGPLTPAGSNLPQQPVEVYRTLSLIHDGLLSTIAALIGHVHAHSRSSHSSSYAHLIDMTREIIDKVREELLIVEVVSKHPAVHPQTYNLKVLERHREHLYVATTALVTAARKATAPTPLDLANEILARELEDQEKEEMIKAATGILRTSADVVNATKPILLKKGLDSVTFVIDFLQISCPTITRSNSVSTDELVDEDATLQAKDSASIVEDGSLLAGNRAGDKERHTLSMLERKRSSLDCIRDHYDIQSARDRLPILESDKEDVEDDSYVESSSPDKVSVWQLQQQNGQGSRPGLERQTQSARSSLSLSRSQIASEELSERSHSSLSIRRGIPLPANLHIHQRPTLHSRVASFGSVSATSTVTSLRENAPISAPVLRPHVPVGQTFSPTASSSSGSSSKAGGESMSRDESSRGSATSTATSSFHSAFSEANTADTSPRSSVVLPSPSEEKIEWQSSGEPANRRVLRPDFLRTRSGSTPDRLTILRSSEINTFQALPSPLSSRSPATASSPSETPSSKSWFLERDYAAKECEFGNDGNVRGASLRCLIERMTLHDQTIDPVFSKTFFLTFRMFTSPVELVEALIGRYNLSPPASYAPTETELHLWHDKKVVPVRLRIYNFFKIWLESHWRPETDNAVVDRLLAFTKETMALTMIAPSQRLVDIIQKRILFVGAGNGGQQRPRALTRIASMDKFKTGKSFFEGQPLGSATFQGSHSSLPPSPIVSKTLFNALRTPPFAPSSILDFDPLELSRQFTIMEAKLFCAIQPEELIGQEFGKKTTNRNSTIRMMSSLSTRITGWIAEIILSEQDAKKRTALVKYFIKLGDVRNYHPSLSRCDGDDS